MRFFPLYIIVDGRGDQVTEFQKLYEDNYRSIYYYIRNLCGDTSLAEDLTQEAFYNALLYICAGKDVKICKSWLVKVAHNVLIDYLRKNRVDISSTPLNEDFKASITFDSTKKLDLITLLEKLPVRYRSLILLRDHYGFSYDEIAGIMNCTETTIKVTLFRARKKLEELYEKYEKDTAE
jgi:RNA polymerase sigma-70 factor, ECF subfamily